MKTWEDLSDSKTRFFDGGNSESDDPSRELEVLFDYFNKHLLGSGNTKEFDLLLCEINCDTGRIILAATTHEKRNKKLIDGCSLRIQKIQDYWYDLNESGLPEESWVLFSKMILAYAHELGLKLKEIILKHLEKLKQECSVKGFAFLMYSGETTVLEEHFH